MSVLACGAAPPEAPPPGTLAPATQLDAGIGDATAMGMAPAHNEFCAQPTADGVLPHSVADIVSLLNAAPKPISLPCFLSTLARPLALYASDSVISAQPAVGRRSPRMFLFFDGMIASIAPDGMGSRLLEFGETRPEARSLKAEIEFPVTDTLSADAPFERVMYDQERTSCAFCHANEQPDESLPGIRAFVSQSLRPEPRERVAISELATQASACDAGAEPERCAMLRSLFRGGTPLDHEFPAEFRTLVQ